MPTKMKPSDEEHGLGQPEVEEEVWISNVKECEDGEENDKLLNSISNSPSQRTQQPEIVNNTRKTMVGLKNNNKGDNNSNENSTTTQDDISFIKQALPFNGGISIMHGHTDKNEIESDYNSSKFIRSRLMTSGKYRRLRKRVVFKNGDCNVFQDRISKRKRRYLRDIFTTLVDIQWRYTLLVFALSFILSWFLFGLVWYLISLTHADLETDHLPDRQSETGFTPCVANIWDLTSSFLFSLETQTTIGYGYRYPTEECPVAIVIVCIQTVWGVMIQAFMVGIVFAKMSRPTKRTQTLMFSRNAVICLRDGMLSLLFRVGDMRRSHIISSNIRAQLIKSRTTSEGEVLSFYQHELAVAADSNQTSSMFFIWPLTVVHKIDKESPLYGLSASELMRDKFEIVLILEGVVESTGATTQARTSYLPSEILWGHRFENMVNFKKEMGEYVVDYSVFNNSYEIDTPLCSAKDLDELKNIQNEIKRQAYPGINVYPYQRHVQLPAIANTSA